VKGLEFLKPSNRKGFEAFGIDWNFLMETKLAQAIPIGNPLS